MSDIFLFNNRISQEFYIQSFLPQSYCSALNTQSHSNLTISLLCGIKVPVSSWVPNIRCSWLTSDKAKDYSLTHRVWAHRHHDACPFLSRDFQFLSVSNREGKTPATWSLFMLYCCVLQHSLMSECVCVCVCVGFSITGLWQWGVRTHWQLPHTVCMTNKCTHSNWLTHTHKIMFPSLQRTLHRLTFISLRLILTNLTACPHLILIRTKNQTFTLKLDDVHQWENL